MPSLLVRQIDPALVEALKERARKNKRSAEAEHRALLREVLLPTSLAAHLLEIPQDVENTHDDAFERVQDDEETDVFN